MKFQVVFTGTDPKNVSGGIGFVIMEYCRAARLAEIDHKFVPTYAPQSLSGKILPLLKGIYRVIGLVKEGRRTGYQPVVYSHAGAGLSLFRELILLFIAGLYTAQTVIHIHAAQLDAYLDSRWRRGLLKIGFATVDALIVLTPWWKDRLLAAGVRQPIWVIPNPLPRELAIESLNLPCKNLQSNEDGNIIRIFTMSRIVPGKNVDIVLKALGCLPANVLLEIAGEGSEKKTILTLIHTLGLQERVRFLGWVTGEDKAAAFRRADIFCSPSTFDSFPMSFVEAMCYGLPIVGVNWAGLADLVLQGKTGVLVDQAEPGMVAEALEKLLDARLRSQMGMAAKQWVNDLSSPERVGRMLLECLETVQ